MTEEEECLKRKCAELEEWIEGHKKKSGYHDVILYVIAAVTAFCFFVSLLIFMAFASIPPVVSILLVLLLPAVYFTFLCSKIYKANK